MKHRSMLAAALTALIAFSPAAARAHEHMHQDMQMIEAKPLTGRSVYNLDSKWTTQDGATVALASLRGEPVVAAMIYTSCKDICPAIVADMMWIEKHLPASAAGRVKFALFSFDPAVDSPPRLKAYADERGLDPDRWTLFQGDDDAARELAAALGVSYRPDGQGGFLHSAVISLFDANGEIVFQQRGAQASSSELLASLNGLLAK
jgi:protein SCO1/2